jgi:membrane protein
MSALRRRLAALVDSVKGRPRVVTSLAVFDAYGAAGGGLLAGGLAYAGLLASLAGCLLIVGLVGFLVRDPVRQAALVDELAQRVPPLAGLLHTGLERVADSAVEFSIIGLLGLAWGIGRFYDALDTAFGRVFSGDHQRGFLSRLVRGLGVAGVLVGAIVGSVVLGTVTALVDSILPPDVMPIVGGVASVGFALTPILLYVAGVGAIYRWVPPSKVPWRYAGRPTLVVALGLAVLSNVFVAIQGRLLGALEIFSGFVVVLATMVWLSFGFQLLLLGAAWVRVRQTSVRGG